MGGNYLDTDCISDDGQTLTVWLVEEHEGASVLGIVGIYGDEDWAGENAQLNAEESDVSTRVREATYKLHASRVVYRARRPRR